MPEDPGREFQDWIFPDSHQAPIIYLFLSSVAQGSEPNPPYVYEERGERKSAGFSVVFLQLLVRSPGVVDLVCTLK